MIAVTTLATPRATTVTRTCPTMKTLLTRMPGLLLALCALAGTPAYALGPSDTPTTDTSTNGKGSGPPPYISTSPPTLTVSRTEVPLKFPLSLDG
jgi:hypothetical protein